MKKFGVALPRIIKTMLRIDLLQLCMYNTHGRWQIDSTENRPLYYKIFVITSIAFSLFLLLFFLNLSNKPIVFLLCIFCLSKLKFHSQFIQIINMSMAGSVNCNIAILLRCNILLSVANPLSFFQIMLSSGDNCILIFTNS